MQQKETKILRLETGWKFIHGEPKRWERVDHGVCYDMTKAGHEVARMEVFLHQNDWQDVTVPHDWNTEQPASPEYIPSLGFKPRDEGWYYNEFELPEYAEDASVLLDFEGVMGESVVYVNGVLAARNETGYTGFALDISDYVLAGQKNMIVVSVDNRRWEGWWYEGAGIYRPVTVQIRPAVHFGRMKTFVKPVLNEGKWTVDVTAGIENAAGESVPVTVRAQLFDAQGEPVGCAEASAAAAAYGETACGMQIALENAQMWSPDEPYLYSAKVELLVGGEVIGAENLRFGCRNIEWTDHGMYINGKKTRVNGICCHQDHVGVGIAVTKSLIRMRMKKLKEMGCNAIRCAHNPPSAYQLEVCDEIGLMVMAENRHFRSSEEVLKQLDEMVLLSRNHPSVFLYSLFNEEHWQGEIRGRRMAAKMTRRVKALDDTRPVTAAMNGGVLMRENASDVLDVAGINYCLGDYMKYAERRPGHPMLATENGPLYATRDIYADDSEAQVYNSYGLTTSYFGQTLQDTVKAVEAAPHLVGLFVWGGFDYRGEPQPFEWPSVYSHWGLYDSCGFEKNTFHMLKSYYEPEDRPMLHLLPYWNWVAGEDVRVCAMTNCGEVRFFLNGKLMGTVAVEDRRAEMHIPYEPGVLRAEGVYEGRLIADEVRTAGAPAKLEIIDAAEEKDYDSSIVNVRLMDENGVPSPGRGVDRLVTFHVEAGRIIGVGNGDPNGVLPEIADNIPTFCGRCQAIIRPDASGKVKVRICAEGLPEAVYERG